ncbi:DUF72 domain-containing protein [Azospirillum sp. ST 5-10]|uniref:DUF72 domain-containing protein n=1 Tax=unclassified Azospirillum TaxID=2630922 RepID=UPI003F4A769F
MHPIRIGTAGWSVPKAVAGAFPIDGSHLQRYARVLPAVEIDTSFYRPHMPETYARWAAATPPGFRFAVKLPRAVTHEHRLAAAEEPLARFLDAAANLGDRLGPLLVQLPPSLRHDAGVAAAFFATLRRRFAGDVVCEPRHPSWFAPQPERLLADHRVARVAADPPPAPGADVPGGWDRLVYVRLHGAPEMYHSPYGADALDRIAALLRADAAARPVWCIFDNTALGHAAADALALRDRLPDGVN